ncbi:MAG: hypothetical protein ACI9GH_000091 [Candidatus Paceibacteria bacterium]|jgi:hypothetical protein
MYNPRDLVIVSIALITLFLAGGKIFKSLVYLAGSFLSQAVGDFYFTYLDAEDFFWNGHLVDFFFIMFSGILLAYEIIEIIKQGEINRI